MIDYRALMIHLRDGVGFLSEQTADAILGTSIPEMCPDCKGTGAVNGKFVCLSHPDAPTIEELLKLGETTWKVTRTLLAEEKQWTRCPHDSACEWPIDRLGLPCPNCPNEENQ